MSLPEGYMTVTKALELAGDSQDLQELLGEQLAEGGKIATPDHPCPISPRPEGIDDRVMAHGYTLTETICKRQEVETFIAEQKVLLEQQWYKLHRYLKRWSAAFLHQHGELPSVGDCETEARNHSRRVGWQLSGKILERALEGVQHKARGRPKKIT